MEFEEQQLPSLIRHDREEVAGRTHESEGSSDPVYFSSEDEDEDHDSEKYSSPRNKKRTAGSWFSARSKAAPRIHEAQRDIHYLRRKRVLHRQNDSGVFMTDDLMPNDDYSCMTDDEINSLYPSNRRPIAGSSWYRKPGAKLQPTPEDSVRRVIHRCLEESRETVNLTSSGLTKLTNETIRPLASLARAPNVVANVFETLEPRIQLFLACNNLTTLPRDLFMLRDLVVLSVRHNQLNDLPQGFGYLNSLEELNISHNNLPYLPYDFLNLFSGNKNRLRNLQIHSNPFVKPLLAPDVKKSTNEPTENQKSIWTTKPFNIPIQLLSLALTGHYPLPPSGDARWKLTRQALTEVSFLDICGSLVKGPNLPSLISSKQNLPIQPPNQTPTPPTHRSSPNSRSPSLIETCLRTLSKYQDLSALVPQLPPDIPQIIFRGIQKIEDEKEAGRKKCDVCGQKYIIARTEWVEWYEIAQTMRQTPGMTVNAASPLGVVEAGMKRVFEEWVPLIRRGCSWSCLPEKDVPSESA